MEEGRDGREDGADYDYDWTSLVTKMQLGLELKDRKTRLGKLHRRCFTGKDAVDMLVATSICTDNSEAVHLLNRMLRRGHIHHVGLSKLVEDRSGLFYRFAEDEYNILVERYERRRLRGGGWSGPGRSVGSAGSSASSHNGASVSRGLVSTLSGGISGLAGGQSGSGGSVGGVGGPGAAQTPADGSEEAGRVRSRRRRSSTVRFGAVSVPEQWYEHVPVVPPEKIEMAARRMVYDMTVGDATRNLRTFKKAFTGRAAVKFLVSQGFATSASSAAQFGNALLRAGVFRHVLMELPFTDSGAVYRLAEDHYQLLLEKYLMSKPRLASSMRGPGAGKGTKANAAGAAALAAAAAAANLGGPSALEPATSSRYWTSYRASKLYGVNLVVQEAFLDMSDDWDSHVDGLFATYCECYLTRDKEGTTHRTNVAPKSLHLVWHAPIFFSDVDYLDTIRIDLKAKSQVGSDLALGSLEFEAHEVMGSKARPIVLEFECGSRQFVECAAAIITVSFDPQVAEGSAHSEAHHHLLRTETLRELEVAAATFDKAEDPKRRGSKLSNIGASMHGGIRKGSGGHRGSIVRPSMTQSIVALGNVYVSVSGHSGTILLQESEPLALDGRRPSFSQSSEAHGPLASLSPWQANGYVGPVVPSLINSGSGSGSGGPAAAAAVTPGGGSGITIGGFPALRRGSGSRRPSLTTNLGGIAEGTEEEGNVSNAVAAAAAEAALGAGGSSSGTASQAATPEQRGSPVLAAGAGAALALKKVIGSAVGKASVVLAAASPASGAALEAPHRSEELSGESGTGVSVLSASEVSGSNL